MIITFEDAFHGVDLERDAVTRDAIEAVCHSVRRGEHFLFAQRSLIKALAASDQLSMTARGVFRHLESEFSLISGLLQRLEYRVTVTLGGGVIQRSDERHWLVPAEHVARHGVRAVMLLTENAQDGDIYVHAARHFRVTVGLSGVELRVAPRGGGGATTADEFRRVAERGEDWCLCVTDSDRECPAGGVGATAAACERIASESRAVARHLSTHGRELENVVPLQIFLDLAEKTHPEAVELYQARVVGYEESVLRYVDLKDGVTLKRVFAYGGGTPARAYWLSVVQAAREAGGFGEECIENATCPSEGDCGCLLFKGFGDRIAARFYEYLSSQSAHKSLERAKGSVNFQDWLDIGREVFGAAAAPKPMRS